MCLTGLRALQVLEVNPGSERTGALLTRAVGEATQSRRLAQVPLFWLAAAWVGCCCLVHDLCSCGASLPLGVSHGW